jgi:hypothetical protein
MNYLKTYQIFEKANVTDPIEIIKKLNKDKDAKYTLNNMQHLKPYNETLMPQLERVLELTKYHDQTLLYWLQYETSSERSYEQAIDARRACISIVEEFESEGEAKAKNKDILIDEMMGLAKILISFKGYVNRIVLTAYCTQHMDIEEWAKSDILKDMNKKTGIFEKMTNEKKKRLQSKGWKIGTVKEFLNLSNEEAKKINK